MASKKDLVVARLNEAVEAAKWKLENYKKTFGKFPGSYDKILAVMKSAANEDEDERELEDTLLWLDYAKVTKTSLEFELDVGPHNRRFTYNARSKKWTSVKVSFNEEWDEEFEDDEYDGVI